MRRAWGRLRSSPARQRKAGFSVLYAPSTAAVLRMDVWPRANAVGKDQESVRRLFTSSTSVVMSRSRTFIAG